MELEKNPTNLLSNENYIFYAFKRKTVKRINYKTWYNYCLEDGMALGLYTTNTPKNKKSINISETMNKFYKVLNIVLCILCISIIAFILFKYSPLLSILAIPFGLLLGKLFYTILKFIFSIIEGIFLIIFEAKNTIDEQYNKEISKIFKLNELASNGEIIISNNRHKYLIKSAHEEIKQAQEAIENNMPSEIISTNIRNALQELGKITGETVTDDVIKNKTGFSSNAIMRMIEKVFSYTDLDIKNEYWNSYDLMNQLIIERID